MEKAVFTIDADKKFTVSGINDGLLWNGWNVPLFTEKTCQDIISKSGELEHRIAIINGELFAQNEDSDGAYVLVSQGTMIDGIKYFRWSLGWIWEEDRKLDEMLGEIAILKDTLSDEELYQEMDWYIRELSEYGITPKTSLYGISQANHIINAINEFKN